MVTRIDSALGLTNQWRLDGREVLLRKDGTVFAAAGDTVRAEDFTHLIPPLVRLQIKTSEALEVESDTLEGWINLIVELGD